MFLKLTNLTLWGYGLQYPLNKVMTVLRKNINCGKEIYPANGWLSAYVAQEVPVSIPGCAIELCLEKNYFIMYNDKMSMSFLLSWSQASGVSPSM